jgi:hypothetical protein
MVSVRCLTGLAAGLKKPGGRHTVSFKVVIKNERHFHHHNKEQERLNEWRTCYHKAPAIKTMGPQYPYVQ